MQNHTKVSIAGTKQTPVLPPSLHPWRTPRLSRVSNLGVVVSVKPSDVGPWASGYGLIRVTPADNRESPLRQVAYCPSDTIEPVTGFEPTKVLAGGSDRPRAPNRPSTSRRNSLSRHWFMPPTTS